MPGNEVSVAGAEGGREGGRRQRGMVEGNEVRSGRAS